MSSETLTFSATWATQLEPYLPPYHQAAPQLPGQDEQQQQQLQQQQQQQQFPTRRPFTTLTYAQSLDSQLALAPGIRTLLSGPASKAMTHYLRSRHDAILVGVGTAMADDPGLNCRLASSSSSHEQQQQQQQPQPVVIDPGARWAVTAGSRVVQLAREGKGKGPWVLYAEGTGVVEERRRVVEGVGGRYIPVPATAATEQTAVEGGGGDGAQRTARVFTWETVLAVLRAEGVASLMVEGGGRVINDLLALANTDADVVDSVIITIAPVWLGSGGVTVAPDRVVDGHGRGVPGPRLGQVRWVQMGEDMVVCGHVV